MAVGSRRACCGARRVEGEEAGKGQEDAGTGGVLLMKSAYLNKREALDMQRCTLGAACAVVGERRPRSHVCVCEAAVSKTFKNLEISNGKSVCE